MVLDAWRKEARRNTFSRVGQKKRRDLFEENGNVLNSEERDQSRYATPTVSHSAPIAVGLARRWILSPPYFCLPSSYVSCPLLNVS